MTAALGAWKDGVRVWVPAARSVEVEVLDGPRAALEREERGYWRGPVPGPPGTRYGFRLDGGDLLPDPASRSQPEGVHGPSAVVDPDFAWEHDGFEAPAREQTVLYELHVGTFTPQGTFDAVRPHLGRLAALGVTTIELLPVAQFPGARNWGYDGVFPFAAQSTYGGLDGLRRLVDAAHGEGLAVVLDVVHNHLGPEGNHLRAFGPYFTETYRTPWGDALNFSEDGSDEVRAFFVASTLHWLEAAHVDGFRLDATHAIVDPTARTFLEDLAEAVHAVRPSALVIAEHDGNEPRVSLPPPTGLGMDAQWSDDVHHALHVALTGEREGYYGDFAGVADLPAALTAGMVYLGQRSGYRGRRHGRPHPHLALDRAVVYSQNHDQVGNRMRGDRLTALVDEHRLRLAAAFVVLSPGIPLLFMGEEHGEPNPFPYVVDHQDPDLVQAVRDGRRREFARFGWEGEPPDPAAEDTFRAAVIDHDRARSGHHLALWGWYHSLLALRRELFGGTGEPVRAVDLDERTGALQVERPGLACEVLCAYLFGDEPAEIRLPPGDWTLREASLAPHDHGDGRLELAPWSAVVLVRPAE